MNQPRASTDTIAAIATPLGRGGIGILRVSGPGIAAMLPQLFRTPPAVGRANLRSFLDEHGEPIDNGLALLFEAPASYTGEDVLELQGHGGRMVMTMLLERVLSLGARNARPGEFTERAFLNDKLDLAQAEAVADLIDSRTVAAARSAQRSLEGDLSRHVNEILDALVEARMWTEAAIDFPEEEIDFLEDQALVARLDRLDELLARSQRAARQGALLNEGLTLVITGPPNVGKSSLLNHLAGRERAIVTDVPGTTRDVLHEDISLRGVPVRIIDTAGLRDTDDPVESVGIARAREAIAQADLLISMNDDNASQRQATVSADAVQARVPCIVVYNKIDMSGGSSGVRQTHGEHSSVGISATTGAGVSALVDELARLAGLEETGESAFLARGRHVDALQRCTRHVTAARRVLHEQAAGELVAEELRYAQQVLSEITGAFGAEDLLDRIFRGFCIGK